MTFQESIKTCLAKYADFSGTASRSEYWYFVLFLIAGSFLIGVITGILGFIASILGMLGSLASVVFSLGCLIPSIAAATRRLHDTGRSGWWQLIAFVPLVGWIVLIVFLAQEGKPSEFA